MIAIKKIVKNGVSKEQLIKAVDEVDVNVIEQDYVDILFKDLLPNKKEVAAINEKQAAGFELEELEQFFYDFSQVSRLSEKATLIKDIWFIKKDVDLLRDQLEIIVSTLGSLVESQKIKGLFEVFLTLGNVFNGIGFNGGGVAFKLSSIRNILDTSSSDKSFSLMDYIYDQIQNNKALSHVKGFQVDLESIDRASGIGESPEKDKNQNDVPRTGLTLRLEACVEILQNIKSEIEAGNECPSLKETYDGFIGMMDNLKSRWIQAISAIDSPV